MPNIVHNKIEMYFEADDDMSAFRKKINKSEHENMDGLLLGYSLYPPPKDCEDEYAWTIANYGGKWGDWYTQEKVNYRANVLTYTFESAWAPLITLFFRINEDYKLFMKLSHWSMDNMQEGQIILDKDGTVIKDECVDLNYDDLFSEDVVD